MGACSSCCAGKLQDASCHSLPSTNTRANFCSKADSFSLPLFFLPFPLTHSRLMPQTALETAFTSHCCKRMSARLSRTCCSSWRVSFYCSLCPPPPLEARLDCGLARTRSSFRDGLITNSGTLGGKKGFQDRLLSSGWPTTGSFA